MNPNARVQRTRATVLIGMYALALTAALVAPMASSSGAAADSFGGGPPTMGYRADDLNQDYCTTLSWPSDWGYPFVDAMVNLDAQSEMYDTYSASCGSQTDLRGIRSTSAFMGSGVRGSYQCVKFITANYRCDQGDLRVNIDLLNDYTQRRKTFCHEIGHSVGLEHYASAGAGVVPGENNDCMKSGTVGSDQWWIQYSDHHQSHIDGVF